MSETQTNHEIARLPFILGLCLPAQIWEATSLFRAINTVSVLFYVHSTVSFV